MTSHADRPNTLRGNGWPQLLMRNEWHWFANFTFPVHKGSGHNGSVHPEVADKAFRHWASQINRDLWGPRWHKKDHGGLIWARGEELTKAGRLHFHAVIASPVEDLNRQVRRFDAMEQWLRDQKGFARIYRPYSQADVCCYVSKYVSKGGEVEFSKNFGKVRTPGTFDNVDFAGRGVLPFSVETYDRNMNL